MKSSPFLKFLVHFFVLINTVQTFASDQKTIKIVADPWCPYTCEPNSSRPGLFIELANQIFTPLGYTVSYESLNWARAVTETREGKFQAIAGALKGDAPDFKFSQLSPFSQLSCFFVPTKSQWTFKEVSSLVNMRLGTVRDYTYGEPLDSYVEKFKTDKTRIEIVSGTKTADRLYSMLLDNRIEVMVEDLRVADFVLNESKRSNFVKQVGCLSPNELYLAFSPKASESVEWAKIFDREFAKMKKDGRFKKLISSY